MFGKSPPKTNILISLLSREYVGYDGILGRLMNNNSSGFLGTFPLWSPSCKVEKLQADGHTIKNVRDSIADLITANREILRERDILGRSPLHLICCIPSPGQTDVVNLIISAKPANVNILDTMNRTPLHYVLNPFNIEYYVKHGNVDCFLSLLRLLLDFGAKVNALDIQGTAPLHLALDFPRSGFPGRLQELPDILKMLRKFGVDVNKEAHSMSCRPGTIRLIRSSLKPLHLACSMDGCSSIEAIKLLLSPETVNCLDSLGRTPLHTVIMSMRKTLREISFVRDVIFPSETNFILEKVDILLQAGADVNVEDADGLSPLLTAIEYFNYEHSVDIIKKLLSNGAIATRRDRERKTTPLHLACQYYDKRLPELLPYFIKGGARINVPDYKLCTPLHYALKKQCCSVTTLKTLVDAGGNVMSLDQDGNNCLHFVCDKGHPEFKSIVEFLVEKGCCVNDVNRHGNTPLLHHLQSDHNKESVQALLDVGANCKVTNAESISPLHLLCRSLVPSKGCVEIVDLIIKGGADVNSRDRSCSTPLFYAVKDEPTVDEDVVQSLLVSGANPNLANDIGMTPLHVVSSYGNAQLARLLLTYNANVHVVNAEGNTALHEASRARKGQPQSTCRTLVEAGANVAAQNFNRCTPFMMTNIYSDSYRFLIAHMVMLIYYGKRYSMTKKEQCHLEQNSTLSKFFADCFSCVLALKSHRLGNSRVTLLNFLLASPVKARRYVRNPDIVKDLHSVVNNATRFRPYCDTIRDKLQECQDFFELFKSAVVSLNTIFPETDIPLIVAENIVSRLNTYEMEYLTIAVSGR